MKCESYLRYLLNDKRSLTAYYRNRNKVTLEDLKRYILLKVRERRYSVPDHYYRLGLEYSFHGISELSQVFTVGLPHLAEEYLEIRDDRVYVKAEKFNDWQMLLPEMPPLLLMTVKIWKEFGPNIGSLVEFAYKRILPSAKYTAFPVPYLPGMKVCEEECKGFSDLHIHLNGALETDLMWHDFLRYPEKVYDEVRKAYSNQKVREQIEQLTDISHPIEFLNLFLIGGRLREWLFNRVVGKEIIAESCSFTNLLKKFENDKCEFKEHPFKYVFGEKVSPLILEGLLYVKILDYLASHKEDSVVAGIFHYYLLITGLCNRLLVQQTDAFGFEQFQKYTSNNFREFSEKTYSQRFLQLAGNDLRSLKHIEGRFSPKASREKNIELIDNILNGFDSLCKLQTARGITPSTLSLIAHFIKKDDRWRGDVRFKALRNELKDKTDALIALKQAGCREGMVLTGIDAAASEFDTPPEVFAPFYRRLREGGIRHFTYHAGEDFYHVLSGIRAIYEAISYLGLCAGDRIGHATASGVDISVWRRNIGEKIWMKMEDYMDDLVFAYYLITNYKEKQLEPLLPLIALRAEGYAAQIYPRSCTIHELISAWQLRSEDPLGDLRNKETMSSAKELFEYRHSEEGQKRGGKVISVDTYDIFGEEELIIIQLLLLRVMHEKQIVIETLPTSNIIIGHHHDFKTYHLYNWYRWSKEGHEIPPIIIGVDDAGIFATNIYNEYCHVYCMLVFDKGLSSQEAMEYIQHLERNSRVYRFR